MKKRFFFTIKHRSTGGGPEVDAHKTEVLARCWHRRKRAMWKRIFSLSSCQSEGKCSIWCYIHILEINDDLATKAANLAFIFFIAFRSKHCQKPLKDLYIFIYEVWRFVLEATIKNFLANRWSLIWSNFKTKAKEQQWQQKICLPLYIYTLSLYLLQDTFIPFL